MSVTGTFSGLLDAPAAIRVIWPSYVPTASPTGVMLTDRAAVVVPVVGETDNQVPPLGVVAAAAVKFKATLLLAEIVRFCGDGEPLVPC